LKTATCLAALLTALAMSGVVHADKTAQADVNAREADGSTALLWAAHRGDAKEVERLIRAGADVSIANNYGATPMMEAATVGDAAILKLLLKAGADVNSPNAEGQTTLMAVARTGNVEAAKVLLAKGADVNAKEQWGGQTALMWAAAQRQPAMVQLLVKHRADVNARATVRDWKRRVTAEGRPKDMNRAGLTPLLYAAREGCIECAKHLLAGGADIDLPDPDKTTPLILSLVNLRWDFAKYLINAGANVNDWDLYGQTPLYVAVDMNVLPSGGRVDLPSADTTSGLEVIELLLKSGANPNAQLIVRPPYRNAVFDRNADEMLTTGATPLLRAAKAGDLEAAELLLKHGALVDLPNKDGITPLMGASGAGRSTGKTRGRFTTEAEVLAVVRLLRAAGADVKATSKTGETALHGAALRGWDELVSLLAADGAPLDAMATAKQLTPLDYAMGRYQPRYLEPQAKPNQKTVALLKSLGASIEHPDLPPQPPLSTPMFSGNVPE
jgi:ankyrin repeat protein